MSHVLSIRFRAQGTLVVLQVLAEPEPVRMHFGDTYTSSAEWRDAKVEDLLAAADFMTTMHVPT